MFKIKPADFFLMKYQMQIRQKETQSYECSTMFACERIESNWSQDQRFQDMMKQM